MQKPDSLLAAEIDAPWRRDAERRCQFSAARGDITSLRIPCWPTGVTSAPWPLRRDTIW